MRNYRQSIQNSNSIDTRAYQLSQLSVAALSDISLDNYDAYTCRPIRRKTWRHREPKVTQIEALKFFLSILRTLTVPIQILS